MSTIRRDPIYISSEVWRWLYLIAKAESPEADVGRHIVTPDEIADQILRQAIREQHPTLCEHQKKIQQLEKELLQSLQKKPVAPGIESSR